MAGILSYWVKVLLGGKEETALDQSDTEVYKIKHQKRSTDVINKEIKIHTLWDTINAVLKM